MCYKQQLHIPHLPATLAFSINAITASNPFSCAKALVSVTNFFIKPAYLLNSGDLSSVIELNNLQASSYPARRAFHTCETIVQYDFNSLFFPLKYASIKHLPFSYLTQLKILS